jgi:hypothetical protein
MIARLISIIEAAVAVYAVIVAVGILCVVYFVVSRKEKFVNPEP